MVITVYFLSIHEGHTDGQVRAIAFSSLIIGNVFLILTSLSNTRSFISVIVEKNMAVFIITIIAIAILLMTIHIPILQKLFSFEFPGSKHFLSSAVAACIMLFVLEIIKKVRYKSIAKK